MNSAFTSEVAGRFGVLPNFFCSAPAAAGLIEELWAFAKSAYLDSPLPPLFKERLFVHLSRFCEVRYCIVRHVGFLMGQGRPAGDPSAAPHTLEQTMALLRRPMPDADALEQVFTRLGAYARPDDLPLPATQAEADLFDALTVIFLVPQRSARARSNVRLGFGDRTFELLTAFLAFVRTAHYWTETHPELAYEPDMLACMELHPELAALLLEPGEAAEVSPTMRLGKVLSDLDRAEGALTKSETRQRALIEGIPQLVWRATDDGRWTWTSPQWTAYTGQSEPDSRGLGWLDAVHPDDRAAVMAVWAGAVERGEYQADYRVLHTVEGRYRWFQARATPVRGGRGEILEWLGTSTDVDDLHGLRDRQNVLVAELQHRTRNLMAVVQALFEDTLRSSTDIPGLATGVRDRLGALARVQGLLSRITNGERVTFDALIRDEMRAMGASTADGKVVLEGPSGVALRSSTVQTFALAIHELATNAVKYGALKQPAGRLAVTWRLAPAGPDRQPWLHVEWCESGVAMPPVGSASQGTGQGRQLIEHALPYQLGAVTTFVMAADGVRCTIAVPVPSRTAAEETDDDRTRAP